MIAPTCRSTLLSVAFLFSSVTLAFSQQVTRLPTTDKVLPGTPAAQFAIGAEDGEDWELLSRVSGVAFDARDNLYVLDAGNNRVLVFDARGKFVRKIGKKGGGPGELLVPVGLAFTRDGYIAVTDIGRPGVSLFKPDGSFVKNLMMSDSAGMPTPQGGVAAHPTAGVVVRSNPMFGARIERGSIGQLGGPTGPRKSPITWFNASGQPQKLFAVELPSLTPKVEDSGGSNGARQVMVRVSMPAFTPPVLWGMLSNGSVAVADEANYRLKIVNGGKVTRVIERPFAPRKATERDKDQARELRRKNMKTGTGMIMSTRTQGPGGTQSHISTGGSGPSRMSDAEIEQQVREMTFLDYVPALQRMLVDSKGRMWIQRTGKDVGSDGPIDIINGTGQYVGSLNGKMPDAISPTGRAAYIEKDDMDVEKVVVRRLPQSWM